MPIEGTVSTGTQQLDLTQAPVIKSRRSAVDIGLTPVQFEQYQKGNITLPEGAAAPAVEFTELPPAPAPVPQALPPAPVAQTTPAPAQAPPAPVADAPSSVQDRIDRLYGRARTAEESNSALEAKLVALEQRLAQQFSSQPTFTQPYAAPAQFPSQAYDPYAAAQSAPPSNDAPITRAEMARILQAERQAITNSVQLANAHTVSRLEAEREFPDVFSNPELRQAASQIWERDASLHSDPLGIKKAALMARGLSVADTRVAAAAAATQSVRKEAMSGIGASVPEGSGTAPDKAARLAQALAHARSTGKDEDMYRAYLIRQGLA